MAGRLKTFFARHAGEMAIFVVLLAAVHAFQTRSHATGAAPELPARLLDGTKVKLGGVSDTPVVLHFWATWCGVCRAEEDNVERLSKSARVVSIASRSGSKKEIERYMSEHGLTYPVVSDPDGSIAQRYGVQAYPTSFFLAPDGTIKASETGYTTTLGLKARQWFASW